MLSYQHSVRSMVINKQLPPTFERCQQFLNTFWTAAFVMYFKFATKNCKTLQFATNMLNALVNVCFVRVWKITIYFAIAAIWQTNSSWFYQPETCINSFTQTQTHSHSINPKPLHNLQAWEFFFSMRSTFLTVSLSVTLPFWYAGSSLPKIDRDEPRPQSKAKSETKRAIKYELLAEGQMKF